MVHRYLLFSSRAGILALTAVVAGIMIRGKKYCQYCCGFQTAVKSSNRTIIRAELKELAENYSSPRGGAWPIPALDSDPRALWLETELSSAPFLPLRPCPPTTMQRWGGAMHTYQGFLQTSSRVKLPSLGDSHT